nr:lysozyme inhibitor LprI family protein [Trinickia caryophylli]
MRACLARADRSSPAGQAQCMNAARESWSGAIDAAYRALMTNAPMTVRRAWQASQRRWLEWRQDEAALVKAVFQTTHGSAYQITEANVLLQPVRDRALQLRRVAALYEPKAAPVATASAAGAGASEASFGASEAASVSSAATAVRSARLRPCTVDAACEHAQFDLNRYARKLRAKLPMRSRVTLAHAQRAWRSYFNATSGLGSEADRVDLIGARLATLKRLSETAGND